MQDIDAPVLNGHLTINLHTSIGCVSFLMSFLTLFNTLIFFQEIPKSTRQMFYELREVERRQTRREEEMQRRVEEYTLSGYNECKFQFFGVKLYTRFGLRTWFGMFFIRK